MGNDDTNKPTAGAVASEPKRAHLIPIWVALITTLGVITAAGINKCGASDPPPASTQPTVLTVVAAPPFTAAAAPSLTSVPAAPSPTPQPDAKAPDSSTIDYRNLSIFGPKSGVVVDPPVDAWGNAMRRLNEKTGNVYFYLGDNSYVHMDLVSPFIPAERRRECDSPDEGCHGRWDCGSSTCACYISYSSWRNQSKTVHCHYVVSYYEDKDKNKDIPY